MHRFIRADLHPVIGKGFGKLATKTADQIEGKVNGHKFDMGEGV